MDLSNPFCRKRLGVFILALCLCAQALFARPTAQKSDQRFTMTDALGRAVSLDGPARRVISLTPAVTEILFAVGAGDQVVGVTEYCNYPPEAMTRTTVGGFSGATISVETIAALKPDLVIVSADMHGPVIVGLLDRLSINSFAVEPATFADVYTTIGTLGRLTGHEDIAAQTVADMHAKIDRATAQWAGKEPAGVFWLVWDDPLMTAGGTTFISEAISLAGGRNVFGELSEAYPVVSVEQLLLREPLWVMYADDMPLTQADLAAKPVWGSLKAVTEGHVAGISADTISRYGPRLADAVQAITALLHP
jgi:iron complex transport system substrate-binding protein